MGCVSLLTHKIMGHAVLSKNGVISEMGLNWEVFGVLCFSRLVFPVDTCAK